MAVEESTIAPRTAAPATTVTETGDEPRGRSRLVAGVAAILVLQLVFVGRYVLKSWFFVDDFLFLRDGQRRSLSLAYLRDPLFEHFSPVHRFVDWAFAHAVGLSWPAAAAVLLLLMAACVIVFAHLLAALVADSRVVLAMTFVYALSLFFVRNAVWWTGGVHMMALTFLTLVTLDGYARWHLRRSPIALALSMAAFCLALLTHEDAMVVPVFLVMLRLAALPPAPRSPREAVAALWEEHWVWLGYAIPWALSVANFFAWYYFRAAHPPLSTFARYVAIAFSQGFLATLFLVKVPEAQVRSAAVTAAVALVLGAIVVAVSWYRHRGALRVWSIVLVGWAVTAIPLGLNRTVQFGVVIGREPRYLMGPAFLTPLALGIVLSLPRRVPSRPRHGSMPRRALTVVAAVAAVAYLAAYQRAAGPVDRATWEDTVPKRYLSTFRADVARLTSSGGHPALFDSSVPEGVVPAWLAPYNRLDELVPLAVPEAHVDDATASYLVAPDGHLEGVHLAPASTALPAPGGAQTATCTPLGKDAAAFEFRTPVDGPALVLEVGWREGSPGAATLTAVAEDGSGASDVRDLKVERGATVSRVYFDLPRIARVSIGGAEGDRCVRHVSLSRVVPGG